MWHLVERRFAWAPVLTLSYTSESWPPGRVWGYDCELSSEALLQRWGTVRYSRIGCEVSGLRPGGVSSLISRPSHSLEGSRLASAALSVFGFGRNPWRPELDTFFK